jgi:hypothetical protein
VRNQQEQQKSHETSGDGPIRHFPSLRRFWTGFDSSARGACAEAVLRSASDGMWGDRGLGEELLSGVTKEGHACCNKSRQIDVRCRDSTRSEGLLDEMSKL